MPLIGVISDTHSLIRPEAIEALRGCGLIIHAGDVGTQDVIAQLQTIAPVAAIRGNVDRDPWSATLPETRVVEVGHRLLYVLHDLAQLDLDPAAVGFSAVIFGHSHKPSISTRSDVLYLNPGSAGPRRFDLPISLARLRLTRATPEAEIVELL